MATDAEIRARGINFLSPQRYLQNDYQLPTEEVVEETESFGIPQTQAFTNSGGGGGGIQGLDPYNRSQGKPLDPNSFLGKTFTGLKNFGGTVVDKFSGLPGIEQGKNLISNVMDNTMIGRFAAMRNPLNPNASNYNKNLQGQIDYLSGLSVDGNMMIGRDPNSGLGKYGPDSVLSGQNVVSGFGTNDYGKQLQNYKDKYKDTMPKERLKQLNNEIKGLQEDEEEKYQNRIDSFVKSYSRPGVKSMFEEVYDGNNIHNNPPGTPPSGGYNSPDNYGAQGLQKSGSYGGNNTYSGSGSSVSKSGDVTNKDGSDGGNINDEFARGGRAGYFFGGRVNFKAGGRTDAGANRSTASHSTRGQINEAGQQVNNNSGGDGGTKKTFYSPSDKKTITTDFISKNPNLTIDYTDPRNYASLYGKIGFKNIIDNDDITAKGNITGGYDKYGYNIPFTEQGITGVDLKAGNFNANINPDMQVQNIGYNNNINGINYGVNTNFDNTMFTAGVNFKNGGLAGLL